MNKRTGFLLGMIALCISGHAWSDGILSVSGGKTQAGGTVSIDTNNVGTLILTNVLTPDTLSSTSGVVNGQSLTYSNGTNKWSTASSGNFIANTNGSWVGTASGDQIYATQYLGGAFIATNTSGTNIFGLSYFTNGLYTGGTNGGSIMLSNSSSDTLITKFGPGDYWFTTNTTTTKTISATNGTITAFAFSGDGSALTGLPPSAAALTNNDTRSISFTGTPTVLGYFDGQTNSWTTNTAFPLGTTNTILLSGANAGCGVTGIANAGTATERMGQLLIIASGTITFTNPASIHSSDFLTTRTITNGNTAIIAFDVWPGQATNMAIVQFK